MAPSGPAKQEEQPSGRPPALQRLGDYGVSLAGDRDAIALAAKHGLGRLAPGVGETGPAGTRLLDALAEKPHAEDGPWRRLLGPATPSGARLDLAEGLWRGRVEGQAAWSE